MFSVNASLYVPFSVAAHQSLTIFFSIIKHCFGLTSPRIVIGPEISRHLLNQSQSRFHHSHFPALQAPFLWLAIVIALVLVLRPSIKRGANASQMGLLSIS